MKAAITREMILKTEMKLKIQKKADEINENKKLMTEESRNFMLEKINPSQ